MKRLYFLTLLLFIALTISKGQTFTITEYKESGCIYNSPERLKRDERKFMGMKLYLTYYDTKVRLKSEEQGELNIILSKIDGETFTYNEKGNFGVNTARIQLNKILSYVNSFQLETTDYVGFNKKCVHVITARR